MDALDDAIEPQVEALAAGLGCPSRPVHEDEVARYTFDQLLGAGRCQELREQLQVRAALVRQELARIRAAQSVIKS